MAKFDADTLRELRDLQEVVHARGAQRPVEGEEPEEGRPPVRVLRRLEARPDLLMELLGVGDPLPEVGTGHGEVVHECLEERGIRLP